MESYSFHPIDEPESKVQLVFGSQTFILGESTLLATTVLLDAFDCPAVSDDEEQETTRYRRKASQLEGPNEERLPRYHLGVDCNDSESEDSDSDSPQPIKRQRVEESDSQRDARISLWRQCLKRSLFRPLTEPL